MRKIAIITAGITALLIMQSLPGMAHHGWSWTTGGNIELAGVIQKVSLGMPHGIIHVDAEGEVWTVEVGQPWRNERAGLKPGDLAKGVEIRVVGEPSEKLADKLLKGWCQSNANQSPKCHMMRVSCRK